MSTSRKVLARLPLSFVGPVLVALATVVASVGAWFAAEKSLEAQMRPLLAIGDPSANKSRDPRQPLTTLEIEQIMLEDEADDRARLLCNGGDEGRELCIRALDDLPEAALVILERLACRVLELEEATDAGRMPPPPERSPNSICLDVHELLE